jgi:Macrocin-O-methyltransferase (TylF)
VSDEAAELKDRVRRLRRRLRRAEDRLAQQSFELESLRSFSLEVFPVDVPARVREVIGKVRAERLTFLAADRLAALAQVMLETEQAGREGIVIEAGTALGGSAITIAAAKATDRPMRVYDVFGTIPPPGDNDGAAGHERFEVIASGQAKGHGDDLYYGYHDDLVAEVASSFARCGVPTDDNHVDLIAGLFEDTINGDEPVAFAHIDGDWYDSTKTCLDRIAPRVVARGRMVIDDYYHWPGCRQAVDEFIDQHPEFAVERRTD